MKAIYNRQWSWRRPKKNVAFLIQPADEPQNFPRDVTLAAIEAGAAVAVKKEDSGESL